jgi:putative ABC transport system permease protein
LNIAESTVLALRSLRAGRLRALLTATGIILGVAAMIVLVGLSDGMSTKFERTVGDTTRGMRVQPQQPVGTGTTDGVRTPIRERDAKFLEDVLPADEMESISAGRRGAGIVSNGTKKYRATVTGGTGDTLGAENRSLIAGRLITEEDERLKARVAVVGMDAVRYLFDGNINAALGSPIRVGRVTLQIIGVLNATDDFSDTLLLTPLSTSRQIMGGTNTLTGISFVARTSHDVSALRTSIESALDEFRKIQQPSGRDWLMVVRDQQVADANRYVSLFTIFTLGIAALSLLIGGIGVANVMFIAVKERTREIGVRKALGARRGVIVQQFLVESSILTTLGGLIGAALGIGLVLLGKPLLPVLLPDFGVPELSWTAVAVAIGVSVLIGLLAGVLPAMRAARLRPIDALRYE